MKFIAIAAVALVSEVQNIKYAVSEGPTKVDLGEADDSVLTRTLDAAGKWSNPLSWSDVGADDDTVIAQLDSQINMGHRHHKKHHHAPRYGMAQRRHAQDAYKYAGKNTGNRDAYDLDPTTTSPYDDMYQHKFADWGVAEGQSGSKGPWGHYHGTWTSGVA